MDGAIQLLITLFLLIMLIPLGVLITSYVLGALGVQKIAQRRGTPALWRAWVPVARQQLLGELSDSMPEKQPFCRKYSWRKWYPIAGAILIGATAVMLLITVTLWFVPLFGGLLRSIAAVACIAGVVALILWFPYAVVLTLYAVPYINCKLMGENFYKLKAKALGTTVEKLKAEEHADDYLDEYGRVKRAVNADVEQKDEEKSN